MENMTPIRSQASGGPAPHAVRHRALRPTRGDLVQHVELLECKLAILRDEADEFRRTLYEAAQVQRRICGPRHLRRESFQIAAELFPVRDLSGDFLSVFESADQIVFAVGDIAGKGLPAGMWFSHLVGTMRLEYALQRDPARTVAAINRALVHSDLEIPLTSLVLASLNPRSGEVVYCNGGHPPALLLRADHGSELLEQGGPLLGVIERAEYDNGYTMLYPGDTLLAYSDGIPECRNASGMEFGMQGLLRAAQASSSSTPPAMLFSLLAEVETFSEHHQREDDIALLVVQRQHD